MSWHTYKPNITRGKLKVVDCTVRFKKAKTELCVSRNNGAFFNIEKKCFGGGSLSASWQAVYVCLQIYYLWAGSGSQGGQWAYWTKFKKSNIFILKSIVLSRLCCERQISYKKITVIIITIHNNNYNNNINIIFFVS